MLQKHDENTFLANDLPSHPLAPRHAKTADMRNQFAALHSMSEGKVVAVYVVGIPGTGKTVLATQYCHKYKSDYSVVLHLDVSSMEKLHYSLVRIAMNSFFGQTFDKELIVNANEQSTTVLLERLRNRLMNASNWLIHVDSVRDYFSVSPGSLPVPGSSSWGVNGSLILATTESDLRQYNIYSRTLDLNDGLTDQEARTLLAEIANDGESQGMDEVVTALERLPLGLVAVAMYHGSRKQLIPSWAWNDSLQVYNKSKDSFRLHPGASPYRCSLIQAIEIKARENIEDTTANKGAIYRLFGLLNSTRLPEEFVRSYWEALNIQSDLYTSIATLSLVHLEKGDVSFFTINQVTQHVVTVIVSETITDGDYFKNVEAITDALIHTQKRFKERTEANSILLRSLRSFFVYFCKHSAVSVDKRVMLYRALGDISVLTSDGQRGRLEYTSRAVTLMEQHDSQLSSCEKACIYLQGLRSAVNLVNCAVAERFYKAGQEALLKGNETGEPCVRTIKGSLQYHYGFLLKTKGNYRAAERYLLEAQFLLSEEKTAEFYFALEGLYDSQRNKIVYGVQTRTLRVGLKRYIGDLRLLLGSAMKLGNEKLIAYLENRLALAYLNSNVQSINEKALLLEYSRKSSQQYKRLYGESHHRYAQSVTTHAMGLLYVDKLTEAEHHLNVAQESLSSSGNKEYNTYGYWIVSKAHYLVRTSYGRQDVNETKTILKRASCLLQRSFNRAVKKLNYNHPEAASCMMAISYLYVRRAVLEVDETRRLLLRIAFHTFQIASRIRRQSAWRLPCCQLRFPCRRSQWFVLEFNAQSQNRPPLGSCMTGRKAVQFRNERGKEGKHEVFLQRFH